MRRLVQRAAKRGGQSLSRTASDPSTPRQSSTVLCAVTSPILHLDSWLMSATSYTAMEILARCVVARKSKMLTAASKKSEILVLCNMKADSSLHSSDWVPDGEA
eukprot:s855_g22.t1